jgi:hypothetical protein
LLPVAFTHAIQKLVVVVAEDVRIEAPVEKGANEEKLLN